LLYVGLNRVVAAERISASTKRRVRTIDSKATVTMAYSQALTERVRQALRTHRGIIEKEMFGSVVMMLSGNMLVGVWQKSLIVRLGPENAEKALKKEYVREFDVTGQPMKGWIMVEPDGLDTDKQLTDWIDQALAFVELLPAK
jgi:TfoX/Sxy family transcriptional regulator of competence genes